jgi:hypothetical protein
MITNGHDAVKILDLRRIAWTVCSHSTMLSVFPSITVAEITVVVLRRRPLPVKPDSRQVPCGS